MNGPKHNLNYPNQPQIYKQINPNLPNNYTNSPILNQNTNNSPIINNNSTITNQNSASNSNPINPNIN